MRFPVLSTVVFLPAAAAALVLLTRRRGGQTSRGIALTAVCLDLLLALLLHLFYPTTGGAPAWQEHRAWIPYFGAFYDLAADGVSLPFVALTCLLAALAIAVMRWDREPEPLAAALLLQSALLGTFLARDALLFFCFWCLTLAPLAYLTARHSPKGGEVATSLLAYGSAGALALLLSIVWLALHRQQITGRLSLDLGWLTSARLPWHPQAWLFIALGFAFLSRAGIWPFHRWVVGAHLCLPAPAALLLNGPVLLTGAYGALRFCLAMAPDAIVVGFPLLVALLLFGLLYGAAASLAQKDLRARIALFASAQLSLIFLGLFSLNLLGLHGALLQTMTHALTGSGWLVVCFALAQGQPDASLERLRGSLGRGSVAAGLFVLSLAWVGLPGTGGYPAVLLIMTSLLNIYWWLAPLLALGLLVLAAALFITLRQACSALPEAAPRRLRIREIAALLTALVLSVWLGLVSQIVTSRAHSSLVRLSVQSALAQTMPLGQQTLSAPESPFLTLPQMRQGHRR